MQCGKCGQMIPDAARFCPKCGTRIAEQGDGASDNALSPYVPGGRDAEVHQLSQKRPRRGGLTLFLCFLGVGLVIVCEVVAIVVGSLAGLDLEACGYVGSVLGTVLAILALRGGTLLVPKAHALRVAVCTGWWAIAVSFMLLLFDLVVSISAHEFILVDGWLLNVLRIALLCAAIGITEEGIFRGLLLGGLQAVLGKNRRGVTRAVIISSVAFGLAHIDWTGLDYANPLSLIQAVLKVVQTGTYGYYLGALVVSTGSVVGSTMLHAVDNFLLMFVSIGLMGTPLTTDYVATDADALPTIVLYVVVVVLYIPLVVQGRRLICEAPEPSVGAFAR